MIENKKIFSYLTRSVLVMLAITLSMQPPVTTMTQERELRAALWRAAQQGNERAFHAILSEIDTVRICSDDMSLLHCAAQGGNAVIVKSILDRNVDPNIRAGSLSTPLHVARSADVVHTLAAAGADIDARDDNHDTPLIRAARTSNVGVIRALIAERADVQLYNHFHETALHWARTAEIVELLIGAGASTYAKRGHGWTPLHTAVLLLQSPEAVRALIEHGADTLSCDDYGRTPAMLAETLLEDYVRGPLLEELS